MSELEVKYLGVSLKHPVEVNDFGRAETIQGSENVAQALKVLLNTSKGDKFFLPEYGSRIDELLFEPNDEVLKGLMRTFIFEAITEWEKRVKFVGVNFEISENKITATVQVNILATNKVESFVFPFYRKLKY